MQARRARATIHASMARAERAAAAAVRKWTAWWRLGALANLFHTSWDAGAAHETTEACVGARLGVTSACLTILGCLVGTGWLFSIAKALNSDVALLPPRAAPAVSHEPIIFPGVGAVANKYHHTSANFVRQR